MASAIDSARQRDWGFWNWDVKHDRIYCDPVTEWYFSIEPGKGCAGLSINEYVDAVFPEDRERIAKAISEAVLTGSEFDQLYRVRRRDGEYRTIHATGYCIQNANGEPSHYPGLFRDVTDDELSPQAALEELADYCMAALETVRKTEYREIEEALARLTEQVATELASTLKRFH